MKLSKPVSHCIDGLTWVDTKPFESGGFGQIYYAEYMDRKAILKVQERHAYARREIKLIQSVCPHPNILP